MKLSFSDSPMVAVFGFRATLLHGDTLVLDRWRWLRRRLPVVTSPQLLLDVGCGSGAFTIGAGLRGYHSLGLSWDARNQDVARLRSSLCGASNTRFEVQDVRNLNFRKDLYNTFDLAICTETIEHVLDDAKLLLDIARCLKPNGRLLLTTPNVKYVPIDDGDRGPFPPIENGGHVRKGYSMEVLEELCRSSGLVLEECTYCSGFLSQKITALLRALYRRIHPVFGWAITLPLRALPPLLDEPFSKLLQWPPYSICIKARKALH